MVMQEQASNTMKTHKYEYILMSGQISLDLVSAMTLQ